MNQQASMNARLTVLRGSGPEALLDSLTAGFLTGEALRQLDAVTAENHHLRDENEHLARLNVVLAAKLEEYQTTHRLVLDGQMRRRRMWRWYKPNLLQGVLIGFGAAVPVLSGIFALALMWAR